MSEYNKNSLFIVSSGKHFDLKKVNINMHVPTSEDFAILEYENPSAKGIIRLLVCCHEGCGKVQRKWHNFFDHLRMHSGERPY